MEIYPYEQPEHTSADDNQWMSDAACTGLTRLFFPQDVERPDAKDRREAMARNVCARCPVTEMCLNYATQNNEYGFWGGSSESERHTLRSTSHYVIPARLS